MHGSLGPAHNAAFHLLLHVVGSTLYPAEKQRHYLMEGAQREDRFQGGDSGRESHASFFSFILQYLTFTLLHLAAQTHIT